MDNKMIVIPEQGTVKLGRKATKLAFHLLAEGQTGEKVIGFGIAGRALLAASDVVRLTAKSRRVAEELMQAETYRDQIKK